MAFRNQLRIHSCDSAVAQQIGVAIHPEEAAPDVAKVFRQRHPRALECEDFTFGQQRGADCRSPAIANEEGLSAVEYKPVIHHIGVAGS